MCSDVPATMPPKVALIPERKLLNRGVFVEETKAQCVLLLPRREGGCTRIASCQHPTGPDTTGPSIAKQAQQDSSSLCGWGTNCQAMGAGQTPGREEIRARVSPEGRRQAAAPLTHQPSFPWTSCASFPPSVYRCIIQPRVSGCTRQYFFDITIFIFIICVFLIGKKVEDWV